MADIIMTYISNVPLAVEEQLPSVKSITESANPILTGPVLTTLIRLALPTVAVLSMTTMLSIAETYFVSTLGLNAIAAASLVVPIMLLMTIISNGGIGGGVSSAIARAKGGGRHEDAESLAWHALVIAVSAGFIFAVIAFAGGPYIYSAMGGSGPALGLAILYSNVLFSGAVFFWALMLMQAVLRGAGNVIVPAVVILAGVVAGLILSPSLINGWFGMPRLGIAGAGLAQVICNIGALAGIVGYMRSPSSSVRLRRYSLRREHFFAILGIGLPSSLNGILTTLSITALTTAAGVSGVAAIAGYGIAARLEMLLIPIMFGFGTAAIALVGTSQGAGNIRRARRAALANALLVAAMLEILGLLVAYNPVLWMGIFSVDPVAIRVGAHYLRSVGPVFGVIAIVVELYFAGQGAGYIKWPIAATIARTSLYFVAAAAVVAGKISFDTSIFIVVAGIVLAGVISLWGFLHVSWGSIDPG